MTGLSVSPQEDPVAERLRVVWWWRTELGVVGLFGVLAVVGAAFGGWIGATVLVAVAMGAAVGAPSMRQRLVGLLWRARIRRRLLRALVIVGGVR